jgi:hypothetical protein
VIAVVVVVVYIVSALLILSWFATCVRTVITQNIHTMHLCTADQILSVDLLCACLAAAVDVDTAVSFPIRMCYQCIRMMYSATKVYAACF